MYIKQLTVTVLFVVLFAIHSIKSASITQDWHQFSGTRQVTINQGDSITFVWNTPPLGESHTVTSADSSFTPNGEFNAGPTTSGLVTRTFTTPGTAYYLCMIHPDMHMVVIVEPTNDTLPLSASPVSPPTNESLEPSPEISPSQALNETLEPSPEISLSSSLAPVEPSLSESVSSSCAVTHSLEPSPSTSYLPVQPSESASCAITHSVEPSPSTSTLPVEPSASPVPSVCPPVDECEDDDEEEDDDECGSNQCGGCRTTIINIDLSNIFKNYCTPPSASASTLATPSTSVLPSESASIIPSESASTSFIPSESASTSMIPSVSPSASIIPQ